MNSKLAEEAAEIALKSGGNIKFDLKAWNEELNIALLRSLQQASPRKLPLDRRKIL
jgi:hypothetical protein